MPIADASHNTVLVETNDVTLFILTLGYGSLFINSDFDVSISIEMSMVTNAVFAGEAHFQFIGALCAQSTQTNQTIKQLSCHDCMNSLRNQNPKQLPPDRGRAECK